MKVYIRSIKYVFMLTFLCATLQSLSAQEIQDTLKKGNSIQSNTTPMAEKTAFDVQLFRSQVAKMYRHPANAMDKEVRGTLWATFIINEAGEMVDIKIVKDLGSGTGNELLRVLKQLGKYKRWIPEMKEGNPIKVMYKLPLAIDFAE